MGNTSTTVDVNNEANVTTIVNEEPNDVVYICGTSRECQLPTVGRPKLFEVTKTSIADFIPPNKSQRITNVLCGAEHTFVRTTDELYSCGDNNFGLLGHGKTEFRFIEGLKMITSLPVHRVIPTTMNSFFFTDDGEVYAAGYNERGQRATGNVVGTEEPEMISRNLIGDERISIIGGGGAFTILVTESQKIYSCGYNKQGQLGLGNFTDIYTPTLVAPLLFHGEQERVISIKCGYVFAMLLCASGRVYSCGYNKSGQLGLGHTKNENTFKQTVKGIGEERIISIECGYDHAIFLTSFHQVYVTGRNNRGQLALGHYEDINVPMLVTSLQNHKIDHIGTSGYYSVFITAKDEIYVAGINMDGVLGLGNNSNLTQEHAMLLTNHPPTKKKMKIRVACGESHMILFYQEKEILINEHFFLLRMDKLPLCDVQFVF